MSYPSPPDLSTNPDTVLLEHCFHDFSTPQSFNLCGNTITVQPANDVPSACCQIWTSMDALLRNEIRKIGPTATIDDIFPSLTPEYRPQLFHYYVHDDGRAAVAWRVPFVGKAGEWLKSSMVALMMWNGIADGAHVWQMLGRGVGRQDLDAFLWGYVTEEEKRGLENGQYPASLETVGGPAEGFTVVREGPGWGVRIPF